MRTFLTISFVSVLFLFFKPYNVRGQTTAAPAIVEAASAKSGVFKSDRGDFAYSSQFWPDDAAEHETIPARLLELLSSLRAAKTFDDVTAVYSAASMPALQVRKSVLTEELAGAPPADTQTGDRITHLVVTTDLDGTRLYFARTLQTLPVGPQNGPSVPSKIPFARATIYAFRSAGNEPAGIKIDLPSRENPVFEALSFGEWDRFGLPSPPARVTGASTRPTTKALVKDPASDAETKAMIALLDRLDEPTKQDLFRQRGQIPNLTNREATLWVTDRARNILATRPTTAPSKP
jgi:hypothetical protein